MIRDTLRNISAGEWLCLPFVIAVCVMWWVALP